MSYQPPYGWVQAPDGNWHPAPPPDKTPGIRAFAIVVVCVLLILSVYIVGCTVLAVTTDLDEPTTTTEP